MCADGICCRKVYEESLIRSDVRARHVEKHGRERQSTQIRKYSG